MPFHFPALVKVFALLLCLSVFPVHAQSLNLEDAQSRGLVGEQLNGYLGVVQSAPGVQSLVDEINLKRRQLYRELGRKNAIPLAAVEELAGRKAIEKSKPGEFVQSDNGQWVRR